MISKKSSITVEDLRTSDQALLPLRKTAQSNAYSLYPNFELKKGRIETGYETLIEAIMPEKCIAFDGYGGILWDSVIQQTASAAKRAKLEIEFLNSTEFMKEESDIVEMTRINAEQDDPVFGKCYEGSLIDFFSPNSIEDFRKKLTQSKKKRTIIVYGPGASIILDNPFIVYFEVPKNEIQYRSRAGSVYNLGVTSFRTPERAYIRFYFVDWIVHNKHKKEIIDSIDILVDEQRIEEISWIRGDDLRTCLNDMSKSVLRVRPWFEPGVWGGQWLKQHIPEANPDIDNYAWSFEFITPENGFIISYQGTLLEFSFDFLLYYRNQNVFGDFAERFEYEMPIRFNFLDTWNGGELAVQCHPGADYINSTFGENIGQAESYYIIDRNADGRVYLGFQKNIDRSEFELVFRNSEETGTEIENLEKYVNILPTKKHNYYLLPEETIHAAGKGNLVLEISHTPYIFTFKLYDYLVKEKNGNIRPLQLDHGFKNLNYKITPNVVEEELISKPTIINEDKNKTCWDFPTHPQHFHILNRYDIRTKADISTNGSFHLLSLVEGKSAEVISNNGVRITMHSPESALIPAAAEDYSIINTSDDEIKMLVVYLKPTASKKYRDKLN